MASDGFIAKGQRHFGVDGSFVENDNLGFAFGLVFNKIRKSETHLFALGRNQHVEVFDVLGRFQEKRTTQFSLQQFAGGLQQAGSRSDGIAWEMGLIDQMLGVAAQKGCETIFRVFY